MELQILIKVSLNYKDWSVLILATLLQNVNTPAALQCYLFIAIYSQFTSC